MKRSLISLVLVVLVTGVVAIDLSHAASKIDFPQRGKVISVVVPLPAGGGNDLAARALASTLEKEIGATVQVVNKVGAGGQVGATALAQAKPDGYTLGYPTLSMVVITYLDPERQAAFDRKSFEPVAADVLVPIMLAVRADSPYKTVKDLVEAAKAKPKTIKAGNGRMTQEQFVVLQLEKLTGAKFIFVGLEGGAPAVTALLGGHTDVMPGNVVNFLPHVKSGALRVLGAFDSERSQYMPDVPTFEEQGYKLYSTSTRCYLAPAGTPKEIVNALSAAIKKAMEHEDYKKKMDQMAFTRRYLGPQEVANMFGEMETQYKPLIELAK